MTKTLYYIECTCIQDCSYPNIDFHVGDVFYFNKKASSNEMYLYYNHRANKTLTYQEEEFNAVTFGKFTSHIPFTRKKKFAKKWEIKRYAEHEANIINSHKFFNCVIKEIKIEYIEEEQ